MIFTPASWSQTGIRPGMWTAGWTTATTTTSAGGPWRSLRAYNLTGEEKYFSLAKTLFDELYANGWDETPGFGGEPYGGIKWRRDAGGVVTPIENASKNMCANGNSCLVAARFAQHYEAVGDTENAEYYREVATKIYNWLYAHLYKGDGEVIDNIGYYRK